MGMSDEAWETQLQIARAADRRLGNQGEPWSAETRVLAARRAAATSDETSAALDDELPRGQHGPTDDYGDG